ncbi:MAG: acyltransferase [Lachnospiraceae bacterium]|nr:acyltransferase [Lachnospiraceae bacterium]
MKDRRFHYVDAARGIAVLLVIYGHTFRESMRAAYAWCDFSYALVYRVHVSLLFLLSGFGYALTLEKNKTLTEWRYLGKKAKALLLPWFSYSVLIYVMFVAAQLFAPCRALLENTAYQKISPAKYLAAMLKNENPYSFHLWYLQTLFLFTAVTFLKDKFLSEKYARRAAILLILALPAFYTLFCRDWVWGFSRDFSRNISFSCSGRCLYGKRWKRRLEFWQQWDRAVLQCWCWKFAFCR